MIHLGARVFRAELESVCLAVIRQTARGGLQRQTRCAIALPASKSPLRNFSSTASPSYPRLKGKELVQTLRKEEKEAAMHEPEEEDNPQILAQATLEAQAGGVMLDDGRLLHVIDPDRGTFQEYLRISLSRLHPILLYQYFHDDPAQFAMGYAHRKTEIGRAREATLYLFISANGWFWRAIRAAERDGMQFSEELLYMMDCFKKTMKNVEAYSNNSLPEGQSWKDVALPMVDVAINAPTLWNEQEFGPFEPLEIVPDDDPDYMSDEQFEAQMERIWQEVKSSREPPPKKPRKAKSSTKKEDLGFGSGDDGVSTKRKKVTPGEEFFNAFRNFLRTHMKKEQ